MEPDKKEKSVVEVYLGQNTGEAQKQVGVGVAASSPAPVGRRTLAFMVDRLILFVATRYLLKLLILLGPNIGPALDAIFGSSPGSSVLSGLVRALAVIFSISVVAEFFYAGYFYSNHFATPGKMMFKLQVLKDSGAKMDFIEAGLRDGIGKLISGLILGIGYLMALFRADRQALHDLVFKTKVAIEN